MSAAMSAAMSSATANTGQLGVWYAADKLRPAQWAELVSTCERLGYGTLWYSESRLYESMSLGSYLLSQSKRLMIGSSIANIYARDAFTTATAMHTLDAISGGRYLMGLGVSHVPLVENLRGHVYGKPLSSMRDYLHRLRAAEQAICAAQGGDETYRRAPLVIAALGPKMLALAAEMSAGAIPYNVTPEHTATAKRILGPERVLAVEQKFCLAEDATTARRLGRAELQRYMALPNYRNNWLRLGFNEADLRDGGSDRFIDAMVAWGGRDRVRQRIDEHLAAGATHVCIQPVTETGDFATVLQALTVMAPT